MVKCLITRPNHDKVTSYLFSWSKSILEEKYPNDIEFLRIEEKDVTLEKVESYLKKQNPRIVLFNGHGNDNLIYGFKDQPIIETGKNEELLKGKIIYSLSYSSAKELGVSAVKKGAETFIGYEQDFVMYTDSDREATPLKDNIAESFIKPSNRLSISLLKGNTAKESSNKSKEEFKREVRKYLTESSFEGSERLAMGLLWNMNSQVVLGNEEAKMQDNVRE